MIPALLVLDPQKAFHSGRAEASMDAACESINDVAAAFRGKGLPVVLASPVNKGQGPLPGDPDFEFVDALDTVESDYRVHRECGNAFSKTDCLALLRAMGAL